MVSLRLYNRHYDCPTNAALLLVGKKTRRFMPGAYVQYVSWRGLDNASQILNQLIFEGNLCTLLPQLDTFIDMAIVQKRPMPVSALREEVICNYPKWAIRELLMNAIMHRDYNGNAPVRFYQYPDRIEIVNHGGLYGKARPENFPNVNDYRNPAVADAMRILGYVNMLNHGIPEVQRELLANGNGNAAFSIDRITTFETRISLSQTWSQINKDESPVNPPVNPPVNLPENLHLVLNEIRRNPGVTYDELAMATNKHRDTIRGQMKRLRTEFHLIERVGSDKNGYWRILTGEAEGKADDTCPISKETEDDQ